MPHVSSLGEICRANHFIGQQSMRILAIFRIYEVATSDEPEFQIVGVAAGHILLWSGLKVRDERLLEETIALARCVI